MNIEIRHLQKAFDGLSVLDDISMDLEQGQIYCLMGASGSGKTTLLRILMGLETADGGMVLIKEGPAKEGSGHSCIRMARAFPENPDGVPGAVMADQRHKQKQTPPRLAAVFQENRLCEGFTPLENVMLCAGRGVTPDDAKSELCKLLPEESISRPVYTLSGGMKRRTAICRALLADGDIILMDEPFTGLDEETKRHVIGYIKKAAAGKLLLITTHQEEDVELLRGRLWNLDET